MTISWMTRSLAGATILCVSCTDHQTYRTPGTPPAQMNASPAAILPWEAALQRLQRGLTVTEFKHSISVAHDALDSTMQALPPQHLYTYGSRANSKTVLLFHVASGAPLYYALFENGALATVFRETRQLASIRLTAGSALASDLLISLSKLESGISNRGTTIPRDDLVRDARSYLRTRELQDRYLEPSPFLEAFSDDTDNAYSVALKLIEKYDGASVRIGANASEVLDNFEERITSFRLADRNITVLGEVAPTGWFPNPRLVIVANDDNEITRVFTHYIREH